MEKCFWLNLYTPESWLEFVDAGANTSGFRPNQWTALQKVNVGDFLLCYVTRISRFIGVFEVTGAAYQDQTPIWSDEVFPCRLKVKPVVQLTLETAVPVLIMKESLSFFENLKSPNAWSVFFRSSPKMWSTADGEAVLKVLRLAKADPVKRPLDKRKMRPPPRPVKSKLGAVTVPENDTTKASKQKAGTSDKPKSEERAHTEIQYLLLKLGSGMGFDVWVARNDRGCSYKGIKFADMPRIKDDLPSQFDEATNRTIALIDVLWLKENTYVAAFEVESTTSIYSGLLRMADLVAMQPNIKIPLYLLAPGNRRGKVFAEVNRPTFSRLKPPLVDICSYISFESLREEYQHVQEYLSFLRPEFLEKISERCLLE